MGWEHIATYLCSAGMASLGALWFYLKKFKGRKRTTTDALTCMFGGALMGGTAAMILCSRFCDDGNQPVVVGICAFAGLMGMTPVQLLQWLKVIVRQLPDENGNGNGGKPDQIPDRPSDP